MTKRIPAVVLALCAVPAWLAGQAAKPGTPASTSEIPSASQTIISHVNLVNVTLSVTDKKNRPAIMMTKDDFRLLEDGKPQTIQYFSRETDLALRIGLLIDTSNSIRDRLEFEQRAAIDFLSDTIRKGKDQAFVEGFDVEPLIVQNYTDNVERLANAIRGLRAGGVTSLYDAIYYGCKDKLYFFPPPEPYLRRMMIVISDGEDNRSEHTRDEALSMAQRAEVTIFSISTNRTGSEQKGDKVLKFLAEQTGGKAFFPFDASELADSFRRIASDLRTQYLLSYVSTNTARDGTFRNISVLPADKNYHVRAKSGYFALSQ